VSSTGTPRRVVITSSVRWAWVSEVSNYFRILDLEQERVTFTAPVPESAWREHDPNPRGGQRGARGVSVHGDRLVLGNAERLFVFDTSWRLLAQLTRPELADIHEVLAEESGIWVTASGTDLLVHLGWDGERKDWWSFRRDRRLVRTLGYRRRNLPRLGPDADYRDPRIRAAAADSVHLNAVARSGDDLVLLFGRIVNTGDGSTSFAIARLSERRRFRARRASLLHHQLGTDVPNHNVGLEGDLLVYNDSNRNCLVAYDARTGEECVTVDIPGEPAFARGLAPVGPGRWLVGSQAPLAVYAVDLGRREIVATYPLGGVENETVFGICVLPERFGDPPAVPMVDDDPYAFWRRAARGSGFTRTPA
jgi:hypothetical protein